MAAQEAFGVAMPALGSTPKTKEGAVQLYDNWAPTYDQVLTSWRYEAPDQTAALLTRLLSSPLDAHILDAGCGTGLSGEALCAAGVSKVTGTDVSPASIDLLASVKPGVYSELIVADLDGEPLPFATDSFDGVTCVGVLSYITHFDHLFAEWIRVTRPNGYVVFTHRLWDGDAGTDSAADGSKAAAIALEARGLWKLVHESPPSPYMPGNPDPTERAKTIKYMAFQVA